MTVLIVDYDLGFVFWLGHMLDNLGNSALPAKTVPDAALLIMQLNLKVDVLLINLALPGAVDLIAAVHRSHTEAKVVGIFEGQVPMTVLPGVCATHPKPVTIDAFAKAGWIDCIEDVVATSVPQGSVS